MEVGSTSRFLIPEENNKAFVVFETDPDRIQVTGAEVWEEYPKFGLGQRIDFNLDEHPIAKRSFETGEIIRDPEEYYSIRERKRLSSYYIPVTNGDKVMGIIQLSVDWSQNLRVIWQNAWQVEFVNVIVLAVVTVLILLLVKKLTDKVGALSGEQEKKNTELSIARKIQMQNLPNVFPAFPGRNDFDIYASNDPFLEVGGDFYDYFMIDDDHLAIVMADVSEKGVPAALFMMMAKTRIDAVAHSGEAVTPAKILEMTNDLLCENNDSVMFVTVWLGILTLSTGELVTANGGHLDPFICRNGEYKLCVEKHGLMLGAMEGQEYEDNVWKLSKGDTVFVCTDGLMEANDSGEEEFGNERLLDVLNRNKDAELSDMLLAVKNSVYEYSGETGVFDDITMLAIRLK